MKKINKLTKIKNKSITKSTMLLSGFLIVTLSLWLAWPLTNQRTITVSREKKFGRIEPNILYQKIFLIIEEKVGNETTRKENIYLIFS